MQVISNENKKKLKQEIAESKIYKPIGRIGATTLNGKWIYYQVVTQKDYDE